MRVGAFLLIAILVVLVLPVSAADLSDIGIDTGDLDIPEVDELNFSETPIGSMASLQTYVDHLVSAAMELLNFIESIFNMLGIGEDNDVTNLMSTLEEGMNMTNGT